MGDRLGEVGAATRLQPGVFVLEDKLLSSQAELAVLCVCLARQVGVLAATSPAATRLHCWRWCLDQCVERGDGRSDGSGCWRHPSKVRCSGPERGVQRGQDPGEGQQVSVLIGSKGRYVGRLPAEALPRRLVGLVDWKAITHKP